MNSARFTACILTFFLFWIGTTYASQPIHIRYAQGFKAEKQGNLTLVTVSDPWPGAKVAFRYLLKPRGEDTPSGYDGYQVVEVPVRNFVSLSTTFIAFIEQLGLVDQLIGFSDAGRVHSQQIRDRLEAGKLVEVGRAGTLQVETILDLSPDIIFSFATGHFRDAHPKLLEAGLQVGVVGEYMESHPLGRSEWIKFLALFAGKEQQAEHIFTALEQRYLKLAATTKDVAYRPTLITGTPFSGRWYVAGGKSYLGQLFHDAGGDYIFGETLFSGSQPMDIELVYERGLTAEYWIGTGVWKTLDQAKRADPRFMQFPSLKKGRLFNNNKRINAQGGNDYWESGIMAPDDILSDMIHILHPELLPKHDLIYYIQLQ